MITITTPAPDLTLLSITEMRAAAGIIGSTQDPALQAMEARIADAIAVECNVAIGGANRPTLKRETVTETMRASRQQAIVLSRRHAVEVASVSVDGVDLASDEFEVDPESGQLFRLRDGMPVPWHGRIVIVYDAGFTTVPSDLKAVAMDMFKSTWLEQSRDTTIRSTESDIPGVMREKIEFFSTASATADEHVGLLRYRNTRL